MNEPDLHAQWRRHSVETPPVALDEAIRAAAHRAVHARPSAASPRARAPWPTWATFVAAASIGVVAIGVWQLQPHAADEMQAVTSDMPTRAPATATHRENAMSPMPADGVTDRKTGTAGTAAQAAHQPSPFPARDGAVATPPATTQRARAPNKPTQSTTSVIAPAQDASTPADGAAPPNASAEDAATPMAMNRSAQSPAATSPVQDTSRSVGDYVDAIRRYRTEHRDREAIATLAAMRAQYADADLQLPEDLHAWAARVAPLPK